MKRTVVLFFALILADGIGLSSEAAGADLQGVVVRAGGTEPVTKANIALQDISENSRTFTTVSSDDGKFIIRGVPAGKYELTVTRPGYVQSDQSLRLEDDPRPRNVIVALNPTGAISGRIFDEFGEPVIGAEVRAMKSFYQRGGRILIPMQSAVTDDRGEYRLFWLPPGRYSVSAMGPTPDIFTTGGTILNDARGDFSSYQPSLPAFYYSNPIALVLRTRTAAQETELYVPVYFPAARDSHAASPIEVRSASTATGIDITVERVRKHRIHGTVIDERTGAALRDFQTWRADDPPSYIEDDAISFLSNPPVPAIGRQGEFDMRDVTPGKYLLIAQSGDLSGRVAVEVRDADLENVVIPVVPGFNIAGHLTIEGRKEPKDQAELAKLRVGLRNDIPWSGGWGEAPQAPSAEGNFALKGVPAGDYRVGVDSLPDGFYIQSIRLASEDLLNDSLHIDRQPDGHIEIVVGTTPGSISGMVRNEKRQPSPSVRVVLVPARRNRIDLFKTARTGESGEFRFESVPPGDYKLFAWENIEDSAWLDPDVIELYESRGTVVAVGPASDQTVTVGLIQ
jgi:protocatechuate 3,4-dioxygenase beta subunit